MLGGSKVITRPESKHEEGVHGAECKEDQGGLVGVMIAEHTHDGAQHANNHLVRWRGGALVEWRIGAVAVAEMLTS